MEKIIVFTKPMSPVTEAYRSLCANFLAEIADKKVIEVVGAFHNYNSCRMLANLSVAIAQAGKKVLLLDCNLREPKVHKLFGLDNKGLSDCLIGENDWHNYVQQTPQMNLQVLTSGSPVANPVETLLGHSVQSVLQEVREEYNIVLIDVPSVDLASDAVALGMKTDGVVLVVTNKEDKVEQAQRAIDMFVKAGISVLGCVLDKAEVDVY